MKIVGITGNSGTGKSYICKFIEKNVKAKTIDADKVVRDLQDNKTEYYRKIVETFGSVILDKDKNIIRKKLAEIIFNDMDQKLKLDKLTFKYVVDEIKNQIEIYKLEPLDYILVDAPTLIEANMSHMFDYIIAVIATKENKLDRICQRDNTSVELAQKRLESQKEDDFYIKSSDFVIVNNNENVEEQVKDILQKMEGENKK